jgi:hypothetical protein
MKSKSKDNREQKSKEETQPRYDSQSTGYRREQIYGGYVTLKGNRHGRVMPKPMCP